jgi:non-ribosomal peptide synthetase component E (peptide arylation enzyme)
MSVQVLLDLAVASFPERVAVGSRHGGLTFADLDRQSSGAAAVIAESGARSVTFLGLNGPSFALDAEGWFPTRDVGWLDEDGYLFIKGRNDDTIIRGGENIAPAEIEDVLLEHPAVKDVGVVGIPDEEWGERIAAVVVLKDGHTVGEQEIRQFARSHLRGSKSPHTVAILPRLPYNPLGKLLRRELAASAKGLTSLPQSGPAAEVRQEIWAHLIVHHLMRDLMH